MPARSLAFTGWKSTLLRVRRTSERTARLSRFRIGRSSITTHCWIPGFSNRSPQRQVAATTHYRKSAMSRTTPYTSQAKRHLSSRKSCGTSHFSSCCYVSPWRGSGSGERGRVWHEISSFARLHPVLARRGIGRFQRAHPQRCSRQSRSRRKICEVDRRHTQSAGRKIRILAGTSPCAIGQEDGSSRCQGCVRHAETAAQTNRLLLSVLHRPREWGRGLQIQYQWSRFHCCGLQQALVHAQRGPDRDRKRNQCQRGSHRSIRWKESHHCHGNT